jgi:hypothetical protein
MLWLGQSEKISFIKLKAVVRSLLKGQRWEGFLDVYELSGTVKKPTLIY